MAWMVSLDGDNDLIPRIRCAVCQQPVTLDDWFAFRSVTVDSPAQSVIPCHRACIQGQGQQVLQTRRFVLWMIRDFLRQFATTRMASPEVLHEQGYNHYWRMANQELER